MLWQVALAEQLSFPSAHSSTSGDVQNGRRVGDCMKGAIVSRSAVFSLCVPGCVLYSPISQLVPLNPSGHSHVKPFAEKPLRQDAFWGQVSFLQAFCECGEATERNDNMRQTMKQVIFPSPNFMKPNSDFVQFFSQKSPTSIRTTSSRITRICEKNRPYRPHHRTATWAGNQKKHPRLSLFQMPFQIRTFIYFLTFYSLFVEVLIIAFIVSNYREVTGNWLIEMTGVVLKTT